MANKNNMSKVLELTKKTYGNLQIMKSKLDKILQEINSFGETEYEKILNDKISKGDISLKEALNEANKKLKELKSNKEKNENLMNEEFKKCDISKEQQDAIRSAMNGFVSGSSKEFKNKLLKELLKAMITEKKNYLDTKKDDLTNWKIELKELEAKSQDKETTLNDFKNMIDSAIKSAEEDLQNLKQQAYSKAADLLKENGILESLLDKEFESQINDKSVKFESYKENLDKATNKLIEEKKERDNLENEFMNIINQMKAIDPKAAKTFEAKAKKLFNSDLTDEKEFQKQFDELQSELVEIIEEGE